MNFPSTKLADKSPNCFTNYKMTIYHQAHDENDMRL